MEPIVKQNYLNFLKGFSLYTLVIVLLSITIWKWFPEIPITPSFPYILAFMFLFTVGVFYQLLKSMENKLSRFINLFMLLNFFKLILYVILIAGFAYFNRADAIAFIITFFVYYLLFTFYEIVALLKRNA